MLGELRRSSLFRGLDEAALLAIAPAFEEHACAAGSVVFHESDGGDAFYVIADGSVRVTSGGIEVARLGTGQYFGEMALVTGQPRNATVTTISATRLLRLPTLAFREMLARQPAIARVIERVAEHRAGGDQFFEDRSYDLARLAAELGSVTIGRNPRNTIQLDLPGVAPHHALIRMTAAGLEVADLGSPTGTCVNRQVVDRCLLAEGDVLWVGTARLYLHDGFLKVFQATRGIRLEAIDLGASKDGKPLLQCTNLSVNAAEFVAIVGPSGAGKTTLIRLLLGLDRPSSGEVRYDGIPLAGRTAEYAHASATSPRMTSSTGSCPSSARLAIPPNCASQPTSPNPRAPNGLLR